MLAHGFAARSRRTPAHCPTPAVGHRSRCRARWACRLARGQRRIRHMVARRSGPGGRSHRSRAVMDWIDGNATRLGGHGESGLRSVEKRRVRVQTVAGRMAMFAKGGVMNACAVRRVVTAGIAVSLLAGPVHAQTVGASLQGIVADSTAATLAGVDVQIVSVATGAVWEVKTDAIGRYRLPVLPPGEYEMHVSRAGFQPVVRRGVQLAVGQDAVIDVQLEVGQVTDEVTVTADAPHINLTSGTVSGLVTDKEIR